MSNCSWAEAQTATANVLDFSTVKGSKAKSESNPLKTPFGMHGAQSGTQTEQMGGKYTDASKEHINSDMIRRDEGKARLVSSDAASG